MAAPGIVLFFTLLFIFNFFIMCAALNKAWQEYLIAKDENRASFFAIFLFLEAVMLFVIMIIIITKIFI